MKKIQLGGYKKNSPIRGYSLVDDEDFERLSKFRWYKNTRGYVQRSINKGTIKMHRFVINTPIDMYTDHIDGDKLNNQKSNLRVCTSSQNQCNVGKRKDNTSGIRGVSWRKDMKKWAAYIVYMGENHHLGFFSNVKDAILARQKGEILYQGNFRFIPR